MENINVKEFHSLPGTSRYLTAVPFSLTSDRYNAIPVFGEARYRMVPCRGAEIRTLKNGFGDRYDTISSHPYFLNPILFIRPE